MPLRGTRWVIWRSGRAVAALALVIAAALLAVGVQRGGADQDAPAAPPYDAEKCTAKCHDKILGEQQVHPLFLGGDCSDCHVPSKEASSCKGVVKAGWKLAKDDEIALCGECHQMKQATPYHAPVELGGCTTCHNPHSSPNPYMLSGWPAKAVCDECHDGLVATEHKHTAVEKGLCTGCHNPHSGVEAPLLKTQRGELCSECHKTEKLLESRVHHPPVEEKRCLDCHHPHGSANEKNLLAAGSDLCLKCHAKDAPGGVANPRGSNRIDLGKQTVHMAIEYGSCQDCHSGHSSKHNRLLVKAPPKLCYDCHEPKDDRAFTHGAVELGDCAVCHDPHSSNNPGLLRSSKIKELCFRCHDDDVTGRKYIHKPVAQGKCTECHDPHGADNPFNLKAGEGKQVCYSCHEKIDTGKNKHKALERYGCTACHDPHGTANRFQLIKPVNRLCQTCHTDKTDGMHVTTFVKGGHKISGGPDTHNPDRDFSCVSCHNPHGSDSPTILRYGETKMEICDWCHGDRTGKNPELKNLVQQLRNQRNKEKVENGKNGEKKKTNEKKQKPKGKKPKKEK